VNPDLAFISSDGSNPPPSIVTPLTADQLVFYVTAYSHNVIQVVSLSSAGILTYNVLSGVVPDGSFINVIFKVKSN
jgi:hypothetical protein